MIEMVRRFLRQKLDNPAIAVTLGALALMSSFPLALTGAGLKPTTFVALVVIAAGSVSKDASSGALQMILVRPLRRTDYLFGRYLGILTAFGIFLLATILLGILISATILPALHVQAAPLTFPTLVRGLADSFLSAMLFCAAMVFYSTFLPGYGDAVAVFLVPVFLSVLGQLGTGLQKPWMTRAFRVIDENVVPEVNWEAVFQGQSPLGAPMGRWALALTCFLLAAALVFSKREFAYGQD